MVVVKTVAKSFPTVVPLLSNNEEKKLKEKQG